MISNYKSKIEILSKTFESNEKLYKEQIQFLSKEKDNLLREFDNKMNTTINNFKKKFSQMSSDVSNINSKNEDLSEEVLANLTSIKNSKLNFNSELIIKEEELKRLFDEKLINESKAYKSKIAILQSNVSDSENRNKQLSQKHTELEKFKLELNVETQNKLSLLNIENENLKLEVVNLKKEIIDYTKKIHDQEIRIKILVNDSNSLKKEGSSNNSKSNLYTTQLIERNTQLENSNKYLEKQIEEIAKEKEKYKKVYDSLQEKSVGSLNKLKGLIKLVN
jgi:hypothetical protein